MTTDGKSLGKWLKLMTSGWSVVERAALGITLVLFVFQLPFFFSPGVSTAGSNLLAHLYVVLWLLAVTAFNRTLPLRNLVIFWFVGLYPVIALALLVALPPVYLLGVDSPMVAAVWVPISEEALKLLPVALFLGLAARRNRWQPAATDALLLGFAVGAGFAFHEDAMALRNSTGGWGASPWTVFLPTLSSSGSVYRSAQVILGHAGWTALVSLALGLAFMYRRYRFIWLLPISAFFLVTLEHGIYNYMYGLGRQSVPLPVDLARTLVLNGQLSIMVLLVGIVVAVILEQRTLRQMAQRDPLFPGIPLRDLRSRLWPFNWTNLPALLAARNYLRLRRSAYYTLETWRGKPLGANRGADIPATLFRAAVDAGLPLHQRVSAKNAIAADDNERAASQAAIAATSIDLDAEPTIETTTV